MAPPIWYKGSRYYRWSHSDRICLHTEQTTHRVLGSLSVCCLIVGRPPLTANAILINPPYMKCIIHNDDDVLMIFIFNCRLHHKTGNCGAWYSKTCAVIETRVGTGIWNIARIWKLNGNREFIDLSNFDNWFIWNCKKYLE